MVNLCIKYNDLFTQSITFIKLIKIKLRCIIVVNKCVSNKETRLTWIYIGI